MPRRCDGKQGGEQHTAQPLSLGPFNPAHRPQRRPQPALSSSILSFPMPLLLLLSSSPINLLFLLSSPAHSSLPPFFLPLTFVSSSSLPPITLRSLLSCLCITSSRRPPPISLLYSYTNAVIILSPSSPYNSPPSPLPAVSLLLLHLFSMTVLSSPPDSSLPLPQALLPLDCFFSSSFPLPLDLLSPSLGLFYLCTPKPHTYHLPALTLTPVLSPFLTLPPIDYCSLLYHDPLHPPPSSGDTQDEGEPPRRSPAPEGGEWGAD